MTVRRVLISSLTLLGLVSLSVPVWASPIATAHANATIQQSAGITVVRDVLTQTNLSVKITGSPGDAVTLAVPGSVNVSAVGGQSLSLTTTTQLMGAGLVLAEDAISVTIGALVNGEVAGAPPGPYKGVMVVLAQYN